MCIQYRERFKPWLILFGDIDVQKAIAIIWLLFLVCFVAIVIEETFLGGRKRRRLEKAAKERRLAGNSGN